ncbi:MAG: prolyl oligopeptidase family serine peptidase [Leptospira sp.]|jgi:uncharacterized protein|nr:prolyl oligopeptidase family serine peptidase [Leptospira sp.]NCS95662.1 prolyl oligopeptidase family serine peptidase [Leptospira sp.]
MTSRFKKFLLIDILVILLIGSYFFVSYFFSTKIIEFKTRSLAEDKLDLKIESFATKGLPEPEDFSFQNGPITLKAWYFKNPKPKNCGVLLLHGFTRTRWSMLKYTPLFWKRGCDLFAFDHRKHGESDGQYGTFGFYEKFDLENGIDSFSDISKIPEDRIGVLGESYGASTAIQTMGLGKKIAFIIADSPYSDMDSIIIKKGVDLYGPAVQIFAPLALLIAGNRADFDVEDVSPAKYAKTLAVPILLVHSKTDAYTPYQHSEKIYEEIQIPEKKIALTDWDAAHAKSIDKNFDKYEAIVNEFLKEFVPNF